MPKENDDIRDEEFDAVHAYFIGPKGSNLPDFRANINTILDELLAARQAYHPEDQ
ncbi:L-tyrosine decarboxylase, partial [Fusarium agapanthi]